MMPTFPLHFFILYLQGIELPIKKHVCVMDEEFSGKEFKSSSYSYDKDIPPNRKEQFKMNNNTNKTNRLSNEKQSIPIIACK